MRTSHPRSGDATKNSFGQEIFVVSLVITIAFEMGRPSKDVKQRRLLLRLLIKDHLGEKGLKWWWTAEDVRPSVRKKNKVTLDLKHRRPSK
jgi:hypothetical protein